VTTPHPNLVRVGSPPLATARLYGNQSLKMVVLGTVYQKNHTSRAKFSQAFKMPGIKGKVPSRSSRAEPSSNRTPTGTAAILDRYSRLGALYVRRTEAIALTLLLEVGVRDAIAPEKVRWLTVLQAEQELARRGGPRPPRATTVNLVNRPTPVPSANPFAPLAPGASWADIVAEEQPLPAARAAPTTLGRISPRPSIAAPSATKKPSPPKEGKMEKEVPKEPNFEKRAIDRFGMTLAKLRSQVAGKADDEHVQDVLKMSQSAYRFFRASQREAAEAAAPAGRASQASDSAGVQGVQLGAPSAPGQTPSPPAAAGAAPSAVPQTRPTVPPAPSAGKTRRSSGGSNRSQESEKREDGTRRLPSKKG
jgi:hypothetical protein